MDNKRAAAPSETTTPAMPAARGAGIDLSVGALMTFCAVMAGVFLTYLGLPMWIGVVAAVCDRRLERRRLWGRWSPRRHRPTYFKVDFAREAVEGFV